MRCTPICKPVRLVHKLRESSLRMNELVFTAVVVVVVFVSDVGGGDYDKTVMRLIISACPLWF